MNSNLLTSLAFLLVFHLVSMVNTFGQVHQETMISGTTYQSSEISGFGEMIINSPEHGTASLEDNGSRFYLLYTPDSGYVGKDTLVFEYSPNPSSIVHRTYLFDIRHSIITTEDDIFPLAKGSDYQFFDLADNDYASHGPLTVSEVLLVKDGFAYISNDSLFFKPTFSFEGIASLVYQVCDSIGQCSKGNAQFIVVDSSNIAQSDTLVLFTAQNTSVKILMTDTGFIETISPVKGYTQNLLNQQVFEYHPFQNQTGSDEFVMTNGNGITRYIQINIIDIPEPNSRVVDDYIYVAKNHSIEFDVLANDLVSTNRIHNHTQTANGSLVEIDDGVFEFTPDQHFQGLTQFSYTTCINGGNCETGLVKIFVGNLNPDNRSNYDLVTPKNRPIVINYEVPISNFMFEIEENASYGTIEIYPGYDTLLIGCEEIRGNNLVIYEPDSNFIGFDEFDLEYCIDGRTDCQIVKVKVDVLDIDLDSICICADDCVWPGDIDANGKVSMDDLLSLGWHIGETGSTRPNANPNEWYGQYCPDWGESQSNTENLKHTDVDGDGVVGLNDTAAIANFYGRVHDLMSEQVLDPLDYPILLEINSPSNPQAGDYVVVDVFLGEQAFPARELHGLSLDFVFDPRVIDTTTMEMFFPNSSWLFDHQSQIDLTMRQGVSIRGAASRIDGTIKSGFGLVAKVGFIVEDDLDGIKLEDGILRYPIQVSQASVLSGDGKLYALESNIAVLEVNMNQHSSVASPELLMYPNPSTDFVQIAMNKGNIRNIQVFDLFGKLVDHLSFNANPQKIVRMNTSSLIPGNYFLKVEADNGTFISKKLQKF